MYSSNWQYNNNTMLGDHRYSSVQCISIYVRFGQENATAINPKTGLPYM